MHSDRLTSTIAALTMVAALALSAPAFAASDSTTPATIWTGSNHGAAIVKIEPLD